MLLGQFGHMQSAAASRWARLHRSSSAAGLAYQLRTRIVNGIPVFDVPEDFPLITADRVQEILDEE